MRFLADESCDFRVVAALRAAEHEVCAVAEVARGAPDETVIELALTEQRILLTEEGISVSWCSPPAWPTA